VSTMGTGWPLGNKAPSPLGLASKENRAG